MFGRWGPSLLCWLGLVSLLRVPKRLNRTGSKKRSAPDRWARENAIQSEAGGSLLRPLRPCPSARTQQAARCLERMVRKKADRVSARSQPQPQPVPGDDDEGEEASAPPLLTDELSGTRVVHVRCSSRSHIVAHCGPRAQARHPSFTGTHLLLV